MNTRQTLLLALAGLGAVLTMPAHAQFDFHGGELVRISRDDGDVRGRDRREQRDQRRDQAEPGRQMRNEPRRERDGYGYGYERRQQQEQQGSGERDRYR